MPHLSYDTAVPTDRGARVAATIAALTNCAANFAAMHRLPIDEAGEDVATGCLEFLAGYLSAQPDGMDRARAIAADLIVSQLPPATQAACYGAGAPAIRSCHIESGIPSDVEGSCHA